jgi:hypothetical protein
MTQYWEPGTQYNYGDIVEYEGHRYKIIQPHRSQGDWTPPNTPALWGRLQDQDTGHQHQTSQPSYQQQQQQQQQAQPQQSWNPDHNDDPKQEAKKNWYDLDDNKKTALVAGGLGTGLALLGGAYYAHQKHKKDGEEEKAQAFQLQNWVQAARQTTNRFLEQGPTGPSAWILSEAISQRPDLKNQALAGGEEDGIRLFIARAPHQGGLQVGKAILGQTATIGYKHDAIEVKTYEFLIGNMQALKWVPQHGRPNLGSYRPVEGGNENDGTPLFIARAKYKGDVIPGKASPNLDAAYVTRKDDEEQVKDYEILVHA